MLLPSVCGSSPRPPVSVYSTGTYSRLRDAFLGSVKLSTSPTLSSAPLNTSLQHACGFAYMHSLSAWPSYTNSSVACSSCVPPRRFSSNRWLRIICLIPISYASRPHLRPRLTLGGFAFPRNPWASDGMASHHPRATYSGILSSTPSSVAYAFTFPQCRTLPYQVNLID